MYNDISIQVVSLIYISVLTMVYFLKRKYNFLESKIYKFLLISTIVSLVLDIVSISFIKSNINNILITNFFSKIYFISLFVWISLFIFYVLSNKTKVKYDSFKKMLKKSVLCKVWLLLIVILFGLLLVSQIEHANNLMVYYGSGVFVVYSLGILGSLILLIMLPVSIILPPATSA